MQNKTIRRNAAMGKEAPKLLDRLQSRTKNAADRRNYALSNGHRQLVAAAHDRASSFGSITLASLTFVQTRLPMLWTCTK